MKGKSKKWRNLFKKLFVFAIIIIPLVYLYYDKASWQMIAVIELIVVLALIIANYKDFELIKIGKEGVELKKDIADAKHLLEKLKITSTTILNMQLDQFLIWGGPCHSKLNGYKNVLSIIDQYGIDDSNVLLKLEKFKESIHRSFFGELYGYITDIQLDVQDSPLYHELHRLECTGKFDDVPSPKELKNIIDKYESYIKTDKIRNSTNFYLKKYKELYELYPKLPK